MNRWIKSTNFSPEETQEIQQYFDEIDDDKSGTLEIDEMENFLSRIGVPTDLAKIIFFFFFDEPSEGHITLKNFINFFDLITTDQDDDIFRAVFDKIDTDGSGEIDIDEFKTFAKRLGLNIRDVDLEDLFKQIDIDDSNSLSYEEIVSFLEAE